MFKCGENGEKCRCGRLCIPGIAIAAGIVNGLAMMILGWIAGSHGLGVPIVRLTASLYKGFAPGIEGALWGALWGFVDAFVVGLVFAIIYNCIVCCCKCCCKNKSVERQNNL